MLSITNLRVRMPLTPEEEKRFREEIRKKSEEREKREREQRKKEEEERRIQLEARLRAKILEEEEERYFNEKGYVKYINRHGEVEWLPPEEAEKRKRTRRSRRSSSHRSTKKKLYRNLFLNLAILISGITIFFVVYRFIPGASSKIGSIIVKTDIPGAVVFLDGEKLNRFTPDTIRNVKAGKHFISIFKEGYVVYPPVQVVHVVQNKEVKVEFQMSSTLILSDVQLQVNVTNFKVFVDGLLYPIENDGKIRVPVGYHTFMVVKKGYLGNPSYQRVFVKPDETTVVRFELLPDSEIGYLQVSNNIFKGYIYLDQEFTGMQAQGELLPVKAGTYEVEVMANGYRCYPDSQLVNILPGEKKLVVYRMEPQEKALQLTIHTTEPGAAIFIDGEWTPFVTPVSGLEISPGFHYINLMRGSRQLGKKDQKISVNFRTNLALSYDF